MSGHPAQDASCVGVAKDFVTTANDSEVLLKRRVSPVASETAFAGLYEDSATKLRVATPPENDRVNAAANVLTGVIVRLGAPRDKVALIQDSAPDVVETRFLRALGER